MDLEYIYFHYTHFHIISGEKALQTKRLAMSQCLGGTPPSCRSDPASSCHPVRALA